MKEVVIQMSDDMFERIMKAESLPDMYGTDIVNAMNCIKRGIVLPDTHGEIKDIDEVLLGIRWKNGHGYKAYMYAKPISDEIATLVPAKRNAKTTEGVI